MTFVLNEFVENTKILPSKVNENFEGLQGDISDNYTELDGRLDTQAATLSNIQSTLAAAANVPKGTVIWFGKSTAPSGYLICNGSAISRTDYADLYAVIGTTFGEGNGDTTFNLPDLVTTYTHIEGSTTVGTQKAAGLPDHAHDTLYIAGSNYDDGDPGQYCLTTGGGYNGINTSSQSYTGNVKNNSIYGNSSTVQPPSLTMLPCIKY